MPHSPRANTLFVYMNGRKVGTLYQQKANRQLLFNYDLEWLNSQDSFPISLSLPLRKGSFRGEKVYHFFDNLLPDNEDIRRRIQARFHISYNDCFDILAAIGGDCVGALQLLTEPPTKTTQKIEATPLSNQAIAGLLKQYKTAPLGMGESSDFRISIAGAQEKTALLKFKDKWHLPLNSTPTTHIIKLPIGHIAHANIDLTDSVDIEWLCLKLLAAFDMQVCSADIANFEDVRTLVVQRFDRQWQGEKLIRLAQEDMCQAIGVSSSLKYENEGGPNIRAIMRILEGSYRAKVDKQHFMRTQFLFWLLGAIDGHAKNFSISIRPGGRYYLAPIYDVISVYPLIAKQQLSLEKIKMAMSLPGQSRRYLWKTLKRRHWIASAKECRYNSKVLINFIDEIFDTMEDVIDQVGRQLPKNFNHSIFDAMVHYMRKAKF